MACRARFARITVKRQSRASGRFSAIMTYTQGVAPPIEFSVQLTEKDVACASCELAFRWRRCRLPGVAVSVAGIAVLFLGLDWLGVAFAVITLGLMLICWGTLMPRILGRASVRQFRGSPAAQGKMHYQVFEDHLTITSELVHTELRWQAFLKAKETTGNVCLYLGPMVAYVIPMAYLAPVQASQFRELVRRHVQAAPARGRPLFRAGS
jgi:hypothetical protein